MTARLKPCPDGDKKQCRWNRALTGAEAVSLKRRHDGGKKTVPLKSCPDDEKKRDCTGHSTRAFKACGSAAD
ncbi:MAG: hypothetical protein ACRD52_05445 [Candidatus Acidiferrales bacterium]